MNTESTTEYLVLLVLVLIFGCAAMVFLGIEFHEFVFETARKIAGS